MGNEVVANQTDLLEQLVVDNADLDRLEALIGKFNLFEAIGAVRQELRHSDFLSFLLDPSQQHGLHDLFLRRFLQAAAKGADHGELTITPIDLDLWDLDDAVVRREWQNIDILIEIPQHEAVVLMENKVSGSEHPGQLKRYLRTARRAFPGFRHLALYLTPSGEPASIEAYVPISYGMITDLVEQLIASRSSQMGPDVETVLAHYSEMLRRHIVAESEIAELAQRIYRKHRQALDIIYEHRPDRQAEMRQQLIEMIENHPDMTLEHSTKNYIRYSVKDWDKFQWMDRGEGWTPSGRLLLFEFKNREDNLGLYLIIGPGDDKVRRQLFEMAVEHGAPFRPSQSKIGKKYQTIFSQRFLSDTSYEDATVEELMEEVEARWERFLKGEFQQIDAILAETEIMTG